MQIASFADVGHERWKISPLHAIELLLVIVLAFQGARMAWLILVPPAPFGAPAPPTAPDLAVATLAGSDPFLAADAVAVGADVSGLKLHAVRVSGVRRGSAILAGADGQQASYAVGDEVVAGVVLAGIATDHVLLAAGGVRRRLGFAEDPAVAGSSATAVAALPGTQPVAAPSAAIDPQQLLAEAGLRPHSEGGRVTGYSVIPRGDGALLRQAGLQSGDVLLSVNGQALTPERYQALAEELAGQQQITLTYQRDGETRSTTLQAKTP